MSDRIAEIEARLMAFATECVTVDFRATHRRGARTTGVRATREWFTNGPDDIRYLLNEVKRLREVVLSFGAP